MSNNAQKNDWQMVSHTTQRRGTRRLITAPRTRYIEDVRRVKSASVKKPLPTPTNNDAEPTATEPALSIKQPAKTKRKRSKLQIATVVLGVGMLLGGGYISLIGWRSDHIAQAQAARLTAQANSGSGKSKVLITKPPTPSQVANYTVAPNLPRYLNIPSIKVHARVLSVGLTGSGAVSTPSNIFDTAWYNESSQPGQPGAMLIDGHISSWTSEGVFFNLNKLEPGDSIQIVRGDGAVFNYKVVKSQLYDSNNVDMAAAMTPISPGTPGLNLISCSGEVVPGTNNFNERLIVFAEQVN